MGGRGSFERPNSMGWKNIGCRWTRWEGKEGAGRNWTIFMDVICVSSLRSSFEISMQAYETDRFLSKNDAEIAAVLKMMFVS